MAKFYTELNESLRQFILAQRIYFNASAPNQGRINMSPKGLDTFRILSDRCVAYLDLTGSECETAAHIAENGRLTLMFCSFADKPLIVRLYGRGRVVRMRDPEWQELRTQFPPLPGARQIIALDIESIMTTCGFAVPLFDYQGERTLLPDFTCKMGDEKMDDYRRQHNQQSIDGLPTHLFEDPPSSPAGN
ncbi:MAG: pyridoxamine 5'-phosphate oxidase family protein [Gemmataceae bacterium]|nr:pyridoxamine 5'-phosphate oxidase family protein [Gemmataceae bacterium]